MKTKTFITILFVALLAGGGGWWAAKHHDHAPNETASDGGRKIRFYQCSMHPQVKSDKPGKCTICGMDLSPIFEGQNELAENVVALSPGTIQVVNVQTAPVRKARMQRTIRVAGMIDDDDTRHRILSAYIDGRVEELFVNYNGAEVKKGEPLASFYSPSLLTAEKEYLLLLKRELPAGNEELRAEHKRLLDAAAQRLERLGVTRAQIEKLSTSTNSVARSTLFAPLTGTVVSRAVYEGQYVKEGDRLFEIADFSTMWFNFDAYEQDLPLLKIGQVVEVTTPSVPDRKFEGKIVFVDPNINESTRSAKIRVELPNPMVEESGQNRRLLLHRLYGQGRVQLNSEETLLIPRTAVLNPGGSPRVYVDLGENNYEARAVKLGTRGADAWQVLDGLKEGDLVVTYGNTLIDAQAQLNQSAESSMKDATAHDEAAHSDHDWEKLNDAQKTAALNLLHLGSRMSAALSADQLESYNQVVMASQETLAAFTNAWADLESWHTVVEPVIEGSRFEQAKDLAAARKKFHPFSNALVDFTKQLRRHDANFDEIKIFRCPMVHQAIPGVPKNGYWVQTEGPLRNPYFGASMLKCGAEVKP